MPAPARTDHFSLGVHAQPTRGAKFFLSSTTRRSPSRPSRATWMFGREAEHGVLVEVAAADAHQHRMAATGPARSASVSWNGMNAFISVPLLSSHGGVYS